MLTVTFEDGAAREWHATPDGVETVLNQDYHPTLYVAGPASGLSDLRSRLHSDPKVAALRSEQWFTSLSAEEREEVLAVDVETIDDVDQLAREIKGLHERDRHPPGTFKLYNVDIAQSNRYCLETGTSPVPSRDLRTLRLTVPEHALAHDDITGLQLDGTAAGDSAADVLEKVQSRLVEDDPDVLIINAASVLSLLRETADDVGYDGFHIGREEGFRKLAGESTYQSYGQVGYSPARYDVPGRAIINTGSSFLWGESGLEGLLDLVERSWRPLQETAWGSIGTILTAIQIRKALNRDVLIPWNKWDPEDFKHVDTLHAADRGGFTFAPDVGVHTDVVELDFASLYPNIMCEFNISPETLNCDCHHGDDVPGLDYTICDSRGFIPEVLRPLIDDREEVKERIQEADDPDEIERLEAQSDALKWILVSCFGYQGYRNAKFGRIECHEAINAYAREILLDAKESFEQGGWEIVHGIIDSIWIRPRPDEEQIPAEDIAARITSEVGIELEYEAEYDWIMFVPQRRKDTGALTKYFGSVADSDEFKYRGIECRQRSTPAFIEDAQRGLIQAYDAHRTPEAVCDVLQGYIETLEEQAVPPEELVITKRCSKPLDSYHQYTQTVAALERYRESGIPRNPGQDVEYIVVDDSKESLDRVRLPHESVSEYDSDFYERLLIRAAESILSPLEWDRLDIRRYLASDTPTTLAKFA